MSDPACPLISICITTYNHEAYIAKALDSVLMQRGNFSMEVLIGEDGSTDATAVVVRDYAARHPQVIKAFFHSPDDKLFINGRKTGRKNFINNLCNAKGKYIALLDGDDYWLDDQKLQKQISFLENNPEFIACCHAASYVDETGNIKGGQIGHQLHGADHQDFDIMDILQRNPVPAVSVVFRNSLFSSVPKWFYKTEMADWPLHILNARMGKFRYFSQNMAAYRLHDEGVWADFRANAEKVLLSELTVWQLLIVEPDFISYVEAINKMINSQYDKLIKISLRQHKYETAWRYLQVKAQGAAGWLNVSVLSLAMRIARKQLQNCLTSH